MPRATRIVTVLVAVCVIWAIHVLLVSRSSETSLGASDNPAPLFNPLGHISVPAGGRPPSALQKSGRPFSSPADQRSRLTQHPLQTNVDNFAVDFPEVHVDKKGLFEFDPFQKQHPIELLIERARLQAEAQKERIARVQSVDDAAAEYEKAYSMQPPRGFDNWFKFAQDKKSVPIANMFPLAHQPFLQYLSLSAETLRERVEASKNVTEFYTFTFVPDGQGDKGTACDEDQAWFYDDWETRGHGRVKVSGAMAWKWRCNNTLGLILPILPRLPEEFFTQDPPLTMLFSADDGPRGQTHREFQDRSENMARAGKTWADVRLGSAEQSMRWTYGWQWTCPENSPLKKWAKLQSLNDEQELADTGRKAFIADFYMSTDVCYNPEIRNLHSNALEDQRLANVPLAPYVSVCRTLRNSDIVAVPLDAVYQDVPLVRWGSKKSNKAAWRGSPTGLLHTKKNPWRQSQRQRLHYFANNHSEEAVPVLIDRTAKGGGIVEEYYPIKQLNDQWFDIGLAGGPAQCEVEDGSCDELQAEFEWKDQIRGVDALTYKYVVDVDGNAWSSRFRRLLHSNNVVLKTTLFPEWFNDILIPWYHYVPIRFDYSDVYDIMAFFQGAPDGSSEDHDDAAKAIAQNGVDFVNAHWRQEDMQSVMILILLEYFRLMGPDRSAAVYSPA